MILEFFYPFLSRTAFDFLGFLSPSFLPILAVEEVLAHPYLESMHEISDEPECATPFNFDLEEPFTEEEVKELIYSEALDISKKRNIN